MSWTESIIERCKRNGNPLDSYALATDVLVVAIQEAEKYTKRCDDAKRIPDLLYDAVTALRKEIENEKVSN